MKMKNTYLLILSVLTILSLHACENRNINEGEKFQPREIHENIAFHFDKIKVDGIEYLILEKDNNNPHEGFGFMAFRANMLMEKQDTVLAYMRTVTELQTRMYAKTFNIPLEEARSEVKNLYNHYLEQESNELTELEKNDLTSTREN